MPAATLPKLQTSALPELLARLVLAPEAEAAVQGSADAPSALDKLVKGGFLVEATRLVAHALPRREAVWWACMCANHTAPPDLPPPDREAVQAAELWVRKQSDEVRRAAFAHAQQTGFGSPEAWAAVAAFWSGDSMSPLGQPLVPPAPHLAGTAVAGAVALSAARRRPERQRDRLRRFLDSATDIAAGGPGRLPPEGD